MNLFLVKHKTSQSCESTVSYLPPDIINDRLNLITFTIWQFYFKINRQWTQVFLSFITRLNRSKNNLDSWVKRSEILKELMQPMQNSQQDILQKEQDFTKLWENADKNIFRDKVHIYIFYFMTLVIAIIVPTILIYFIANHIRLNALVKSLTINKTP